MKHRIKPKKIKFKKVKLQGAGLWLSGVLTGQGSDRQHPQEGCITSAGVQARAKQ